MSVKPSPSASSNSYAKIGAKNALIKLGQESNTEQRGNILEEVSMEHGSFQDPSQATFSLTDEDHTLANSIRFILNQDPRVTFCGYSIPHPSDARVNMRVQTTGDPASEILKDSCQDLMLVCQHVRSSLDQAVSEFKSKNDIEPMNTAQ